MKQNQTLAQKNRNRPISITDIAISKEPRTHIFGFTNEQNKFIQNAHKDLLKKAQLLCKKYRSKCMEIVMIIDTHTWNCWCIEGKRDNIVEIKDNLEAKMILETSTKNSLMLLHNHPSTGTFSARDLRTFCNNDSLYIMTVVGNDGSIYVLQKNAGFDSSQVLLKYGELTERYKNQGYTYNATMAVKYILSNACDYNMSYKKGRKKI